MKDLCCRLSTLLLLLFSTCFVHGQLFVHPGILHSREDLQRMKKAVAAKEAPIYAGYQVFMQNPASHYDYKMQGPMDMVGRNPTIGQGTYDSDANAAHQNAVQWAITGDKRYAEKAIEIVNAWSSTLDTITGRDAVLMAGLGPFKMINAAEILRYTSAGWKQADIQQTEKHFRKVIYPVLKSYAPFANGNWEAAAMKTVMAIGVFCNDRSIFENALRYYINGGGNGRLTNYVINEDGQVQESGRDQPHSQLGIGMLAECCAIAWNQGLDLYGFADNRLLKGFEYTAKYNLGNDDMPFQEWLDRTGKYHHYKISDKGRGELRAVYEQVYNHYVNRMGLVAPFTQQAAEKLRPEGAGRPGADHPGYGTLYFTIPKSGTSLSAKPFSPAALCVDGYSLKNDVKWIASIGAASYTLKRAIKKEGPYKPIAKGIKQTSYTDKTVKGSTIYYYTVVAVNAKGESQEAYPACVAAGLPTRWKEQNIGPNTIGSTVWRDGAFITESNGIALDSTNDGIHFTYRAWNGDGTIIIRYVPQLTSQFSKFGLSIREGLADNAPHVSLLLYPGKTAEIEAPEWHVRMVYRSTVGKKTEVRFAGAGLTPPAVTYGRLTGYYWLRLQRKGNTFLGYTSCDGKYWQNAGTVTLPFAKDLLIGFSVESGMAKSTVVSLDNVLLTSSGN